MTELRHVSITPGKQATAQQAAENARDANIALAERVRGYLVTVLGYAATGATTNRIYLTSTPGRRVKGVLLANARATFDKGSDLGAVGRPNFYHDDKGIGVYEPSGLTANTQYDLTFLVLE